MGFVQIQPFTNVSSVMQGAQVRLLAQVWST